MKLTVLVDNNTLMGTTFLGEHGLSYFIEDEGTKILFDTGSSGIFIDNAKKMGIDICSVDYIVLSHGHHDHTRGLLALPERKEKFSVVAHTKAFDEKKKTNQPLGTPFTKLKAMELFDLKLSDVPVQLSKNIVFLGQIPRTNAFENKTSLGLRMTDSGFVDDFIPDDSALVFKGQEGIYVITGCSHSGICNIIDYAKRVTGCNKVLKIIGGFHLREDNPVQTQKTCEYFETNGISELYPCHCTSLQAKIAIGNKLVVKEIGVGSVLEFE